MKRALVVGIGVVCFKMALLHHGLDSVVWGGSTGRPAADMEPTLLDPVVVTGTRLEVPLRETPSAITVIDRQEIESRQATDVLELLRTVPGMSVTQTGSRGGLTTIFPRGGEEDFNLVLIDGVPVNDAGGFFDFSDLTTENIERIEVIRGPQSALYGANAMGAVIQIFTRRGRGPLGADVSLTGGSFDTFEGHATVSGGTDRFGSSLGFGYLTTSGFLKLNNDYRNTTASASIDYRPFSPLQFAFSARYSDSRFEFPTEVGGDRLGPLDPEQFQERQRWLLSLRGTHALTGWWEQVLLLGLSQVDVLSKDPFNPPVDTTSRRTERDEQRLFANYTWNFLLPEFRSTATTLSVGAEFQEEDLDQRAVIGASTTVLHPSRSSKGYYAQALLNWRKQATLIAGVRVEDSTTFGLDTNPRLSASFIVPPLQTKLRGGFGTGIRAPSFRENFGTGSPLVVGNPALKPEQSISWEIGVDQPLLAGQLVLSATYFENTFEDLITFVSGATPSFLNIQGAESSGIEAGVQALLPWKLRLSGSYTFLETKVTDDGGVGGTLFTRGQPLLRRPRHQGSVGLTYLGDRATIGVVANVVGDAIDRDFSQRGSPRVTLAGHTKVDLAASYVLAQNVWGLKTLRLHGKIENLLDEAYEQAFGFSAPGISVRGGIAAGF